MAAFKMTTRSSSSILHLIIILVSGFIATAELLPERKVGKRRMRGKRLRGPTNRRKLGSAIKQPTNKVVVLDTDTDTATVTATATATVAASGYNDTTLATRMVLRTVPTIRTAGAADQRRQRKMKKQLTRQRTIHTQK